MAKDCDSNEGSVKGILTCVVRPTMDGRKGRYHIPKNMHSEDSDE
jgi:hypothetical protein